MNGVLDLDISLKLTSPAVWVSNKNLNQAPENPLIMQLF